MEAFTFGYNAKIPGQLTLLTRMLIAANKLYNILDRGPIIISQTSIIAHNLWTPPLNTWEPGTGTHQGR